MTRADLASAFNEIINGHIRVAQADALCDLVWPVVEAADQWDSLGAVKVMHVLTCRICEEAEKTGPWCIEAQKIGRSQLSAGKAIKSALATLRARVVTTP